MTPAQLTEAASVLRQYAGWRVDNPAYPEMPAPKEITKALDVALQAIEENAALQKRIGEAELNIESADRIIAAAQARVKELEAQLETSAQPVWYSGSPPFPQDQEWFIALTKYGDKVILRALPEDYAYDYTTADHTYMKRENVIRWRQFPDCEYLPPALTGDER